MTEKVFSRGIFFNPKHDNAPDFVLGQVSIKPKEFVEWLRTYKDEEFVKLDIKKSKEGKAYMELNTWKPEKKEEAPTKEDPTDLPF